MQKKIFVAIFLSTIFLFITLHKQVLNYDEEEYTQCIAQNNNIYRIKFSQTKIYPDQLNNYIVVEKTDNKIIESLKKIIPSEACTFSISDFATVIKIKPGAQKYFYEGKISNNEDAIQKSIYIMKNFFLYKPQIINIKKNSSACKIKFYDTLDAIKNLSFCNEIEFDKNLNLQSIKYFNVEYKKIGSCKIKSVAQAIKELPMETKNYIELTKCELVYIYDESIIQSAYFFEGVCNNKKTNFIIKAGMYNY